MSITRMSGNSMNMYNTLEALVVINDYCLTDHVKSNLKQELARQFSIEHSTMEFEEAHCDQKKF